MGYEHKPRRVYVSETLWRALRVHCASRGISVSEWLREQIKGLLKTVILVTVLGTGFWLWGVWTSHAITFVCW